jgi:hypothetical protein
MTNHQIISLEMDIDILVGQSYEGYIRITKSGLYSSVQVLLDPKIAVKVAEAIGYVKADSPVTMV